MKHLLLAVSLTPGQQIALTGEDYHYLRHVLRRGPGHRVPALDARGTRWELLLRDDDGSRLEAVAETAASTATDAATHEASARIPRLTIYQAVPKGPAMDELVRRLVQHGASRICPVITERTVVRPEGHARVARWRRIAREAVQQSGAPTPVEVSDPCPLDEVRPAPGACSLVLHTKPIAQNSLHGYLGEVPHEVDLAVGPEGGFTDAELMTLLGLGFEPLWLGPMVLRSENAALYAAAAVRLLILERAHWQPRLLPS